MSTNTVPIRVVDGGLSHDVRASKMVWKRELIRFVNDRIRIISALVQPILFLFVLGTGLSSLTNSSTGGVSLRTFLFPGILATSSVFTAVFSAASVVWDREFGFLREMLVAPIRRSSIVVGKAFGAATVATAQSCLILLLGPLVGVPYYPMMIVVVIGETFVLAFMLGALGLVIAANITRLHSMIGLTQMLVLPLSFLSGAMYPISGLPSWLKTLTLINPVTYSVQPIRHTVFGYIDVPDEARARLDAPIEWWGWEVPMGVQLVIVVATGLVFLAIAARLFERAE